MARVQWYGGEVSILTLQSELRRLVERSNALSALLMDSAGRLLTMVGSTIPDFDITSFVSLSASDFAATQELAKLLGEKTFQDLYHQGNRHGVYMTQMHEGLLLAILFDRKTSLGLVRYALRKARPRLRPLLARAVATSEEPATEEETARKEEETREGKAALDESAASTPAASDLDLLVDEVDQLFGESNTN
jgi:predicted regulator of Ras-like GTPase activity (Roadblock/LC7/MglB family)